MNAILIVDKRADHYAELIAGALPQARISVFASPEDSGLAQAAAESPVWLASASYAARALARGVTVPAWLQTTSAGVEPLFAPGLPRPQRASRAVDVFGQLMAEYVLTYLLAWRRHVFTWAGAQRQEVWEGPEPGSLRGLRIVMAGAGVIGQEVASLLAPFGVCVRGVARQARPVAGFDHIYAQADLLEAAAWAEVVINVLPETPETQDLFDARFFAAMPAGGLFINAGRGTAVQDMDLVHALESGHLGAAAIDVCRTEPLPAAHPFWRVPRLWLTGHSAAPTLPVLLAPLFLDNLQRWERGEPLRGELHFERGY